MTHKIGWLNRPGTTGVTWSPVSGCTPISEGCAHCWAKRMSKRLAGRFGYPADEPFRVTLHEDKLDVPLKWRKPRTVFVVSMGDLFHKDVPFKYIDRIWRRMDATPQHTYMVLTKRPDRLLEYWAYRTKRSRADALAFSNVWLGVTVENQANDWRIPLLLQCPAAKRFVSIEPMLGPVALEGECHNWLPGTPMPDGTRRPLFSEREGYRHKLDWIICGAETGPCARPMDPAWARGVRDQCRAAGVPFFMIAMSSKAEIPSDLMIREWPGGDQCTGS